MPPRDDVETEDDDPIAMGDWTPTPGVLVVFEGGASTLRAVRLPASPVRVGRGAECELCIADTHASRVHAEITLAEVGVVARDLESRNGTFVDGAAAPGSATRTIRVGATVLFVTSDVTPFVDRRVIVHDDVVIGPSMHRARMVLAEAARRRKTCLIVGESGTGKESAARHYHAKGGYSSGPFVAVNCAAIPKELAETELFGAVKGAHSTALADKAGFFGAAHGGVLFLDEIGTLDLALQAKLLRAVETKEITPVGSTTPRRVDLDICAATNADLDGDAERGVFRMDLLQRIRQVEVQLPPLRDRPEEIAYLVEIAVKRADAAARASAALVEACLLRAFRNTNVRGLVNAVDAAVVQARANDRDLVQGVDLPKPKPSDAWEHEVSLSEAPLVSDRDRRAAVFLGAYRQSGNVDAAAQLAGIARSTAYDILKRSKR
ncbi:MAG TPA: sigma 54-interacting transcriptional regulator [Polyangiaceae bacterium]|nr:sigma 54-interacting transcriptional regulator [Polyangiaceae bacterium]